MYRMVGQLRILQLVCTLIFSLLDFCILPSLSRAQSSQISDLEDLFHYVQFQCEIDFCVE